MMSAPPVPVGVATGAATGVATGAAAGVAVPAAAIAVLFAATLACAPLPCAPLPCAPLPCVPPPASCGTSTRVSTPTPALPLSTQAPAKPPPASAVTAGLVWSPARKPLISNSCVSSALPSAPKRRPKIPLASKSPPCQVTTKLPSDSAPTAASKRPPPESTLAWVTAPVAWPVASKVWK